MSELRWIEDNHHDEKYPLWTRANVGEVLPEPPSPLGWDLVWENGTVLGWRDCMVNRLGINDHEVHPDRPEVSGLFGGYAYLNATMMRIWGHRTPGFSAELIDNAYFAGATDVPPYVELDWHNNEATSEVMTAWLGWAMADRSQAELEADRVLAIQIRQERPDLASASDAELLERCRSLEAVVRRLFDQHINQSAAASIGPGVIGQVCAAIGRPLDAMPMMAGIGGVDSAAPSYAMWELSRRVRASSDLTAAFGVGPTGLTARIAADGSSDASEFMDQLEEFMVEFGSRGPNEWDIYSPTWELEPDLVLTLVDRMRAADDDAAPLTENASREAERMRLGDEITEALAADPETQGQFAMALESAKTFLAGRERSKTNIIRVIGEIRVAAWELGRRGVERGDLKDRRDVCMLFGDELDSFVGGSLADVSKIVAERQAHHDWLMTLQPPYIIAEDPPPNTEWPAKGAAAVATAAAGDQLAGIPGCPGVARGRAVIVQHPSDPVDLGPGDILIAPMTDPSWTPLFVPAEAVVVNVGAPLSHAIIVSRELGIPCVVSVGEATKRIPNGATIEVDGNTGSVTIIDLG